MNTENAHSHTLIISVLVSADTDIPASAWEGTPQTIVHPRGY